MDSCKPRSYDTNWNKDIFFEVCSVLLHDCAVLELVCLQFCDYMSANDFWIRLYKIYYPESKNLPEAENIRDEFYSPLYHWDEEYINSDLKFDDDRRTIEEITNKNARWKVVKCLESLPQTEGRFFCFAMDVIRCETDIAYVSSFSFIKIAFVCVLLSFIPSTYISRYVGFGISPLQKETKYLNPPHSCPWLWHTLKDAVFKKGDQVGLVGCVKDGYYLCNFFINEQFHPWYSYDEYSQDSYFISAEIEVFIHFSIVTAEKFTITRPKLGNFYYYNKFKDSPAYKQGIKYRGNPI
jgi:hypothetical protein